MNARVTGFPLVGRESSWNDELMMASHREIVHTIIVLDRWWAIEHDGCIGQSRESRGEREFKWMLGSGRLGVSSRLSQGHSELWTRWTRQSARKSVHWSSVQSVQSVQSARPGHPWAVSGTKVQNQAPLGHR